MELTCQTRKYPVTFSLWTVTGRAWRNIGPGDSLFKDFLSRRHEFPWSTPERFRIEIPEMRGKTRYHRRAQDMRHAEHEFILPSAINKRPQLILEILGLLSGESWHGRSSTIALPQHPVASLAIFHLGLKISLAHVFGATRRGENNCQDCRLQREL